MLSDGLFIAGVAFLLTGTVIAMALIAQSVVYALQRRRGLAAARKTRVEQRTARVALEAAGPADWVWPRFPETLAAKIEEQP